LGLLYFGIFLDSSFGDEKLWVRMPEYKLTYFNCRYLAEPIRWIFAVAGEPFEDIRIEDDDWPEWKPKFNWGQAPVLHEDGKEMSQSSAIARYLARKFKLVGATDYQAYLCDQYVDHITDWRLQWYPVYCESNDEKRQEIVKQLMVEIFPKYLKKFNANVEASGGPFLLGADYSWADFFLANFLEIFEEYMPPTLLDGYPALKKQQTAVFGIPQIKAYLAKRPKTLL